MAPEVLCRAVQELCRCLVCLVQKGNLVDLPMLDVVKKDAVVPPFPAEGVSSPEPRAEEPIGLPDPDKPPTSEPEEAVHSG